MITFELAVLIGAIIILINLLIGVLLKSKPKKVVLSCLFIAYLTAVAVITLFPILIDEKVEYFDNVTWYNYIPFKSIINSLSSGLNTTIVTQVVGNILMTLPFGVFVKLLLKKHNWWKLLLIAFAFPLAIELTQMIIGLSIDNMYRNVDIDDVILNAIGVYMGYAIYKIIPSKIKRIDIHSIKLNSNL